MSSAKRRLPSLNWLRAFEAAARHTSFAEAAKELNVTPAAMRNGLVRPCSRASPVRWR
jgi:hypothetical protein